MKSKLTFFILSVLICLCMAGVVKAENKEKNPINVSMGSGPVDPSTAELDEMNLGKLKYKGSILISCPHPAFGGFSELMVSKDRKRFISITDMGFWITGKLKYGKNGWLEGIERQAKLGRLLNISGGPFAIKYRADSEALCRAPEGGFLVSFERKHRINRYPGKSYDLSGIPERYDFPPSLKNLPENGGIESMLLLESGKVLMITEGVEEDGGLSPCVIGKPRNWHAFNYRREGSFRPTSVAALPGDKLLLLERSYTGPGSLKIRLATMGKKDISAGATVNSKHILTLPRPLPIDNYEGLDTVTTADGRTFIYLISDDNFSPMQHTIMMMFELEKQL